MKGFAGLSGLYYCVGCCMTESITATRDAAVINELLTLRLSFQ